MNIIVPELPPFGFLFPERFREERDREPLPFGLDETAFFEPLDLMASKILSLFQTHTAAAAPKTHVNGLLQNSAVVSVEEVVVV